MTGVTQILSAIEQGDPNAGSQLLPMIYDELRSLAAQRLAREKPGQTLQATALVHEAYLRLVSSSGADRWQNRSHFFCAAAEAMRRILIENARHRAAVRAGGRLRRVALDDPDQIAADGATPSDDLLDLDAALTRFAQEDPVKSELVKLRFFAGLSVEEAGNMLGISRATATRYWDYARAWLYDELNRSADDENFFQEKSPKL